MLVPRWSLFEVCFQKISHHALHVSALPWIGDSVAVSRINHHIKLFAGRLQRVGQLQRVGDMNVVISLAMDDQ